MAKGVSKIKTQSHLVGEEDSCCTEERQPPAKEAQSVDQSYFPQTNDSEIEPQTKVQSTQCGQGAYLGQIRDYQASFEH